MKSPLKAHGGKTHLARRLVELMPKTGIIHRVETHCFGASFTLACDPEGVSEVINDIDHRISGFWRVLQDEKMFNRFQRIVQAVSFSELEFSETNDKCNQDLWFCTDYDDRSNPVSRAVSFFIESRQSLAGRQKSFAPLSRRRVRRGMNEQAAAWLSAVEGLPEVHDRMKRVAILSQDAVNVIRSQDGPATFFYVDPPYPRDSRTAPDVYRYEMADEQHDELLEALSGISGRFMLSGYHCDMYDHIAEQARWRCVEFDRPCNSASGDAKARRTECVWMNYEG